MQTRDIVLGIILIVASIFLIVAVLMQHGKSHNLSGTIAGGAETFFGKSKAQTMDKKLSRITTVIAIIFVSLVLAVYLMQDTKDTSGRKTTATASVTAAVSDTVTTDDVSSDAPETTDAAPETTIAAAESTAE